MTRRTIALLMTLVPALALAQSKPTTKPASSEQVKAAEALLKSKDLTRVGTMYLLDPDARITDMLKPSRQAKKLFDDYARRRGAIEAQVRQADQSIADWEVEYRNLNEQLKTHTGGPRAYNDIIAQINILASKTKEAEQFKEQRRAELAKIPAPREDYGGMIADLATKLEAADKRYAELAADPDVVAALATLSAAGPPKVRLGPSPGFTQTLAATRKQRDSMQSAVIRLITDKGVPQVDVTLNGSVNRRMVLDSGASIVTLTAEVANRLGLRPGADAPTAKLVTADGKTTEAKIATLDSIRLGQFTVEDVACAVLPANVPADECLLGGTFLEHFVYRMDLASGQLFLTQLSGKPGKGGDAVAAKDAPPATRPANELLATMKGNVDHKRNGAIVLVTGERIMTAKSYVPPVTFKVVAQTDSTNIRFAYAADHIIFNWELDRTQFRIDGGPASGRHEAGAGEVPVNQWVEFELTVRPDEMVIRVDGAERYRTKADFSKVKQPLAIFTERGGTIMVKSVSVSEGR